MLSSTTVCWIQARFSSRSLSHRMLWHARFAKYWMDQLVSFDVHLINYPEHASSAREMEEAARSLLPSECLAAQEVGEA